MERQGRFSGNQGLAQKLKLTMKINVIGNVTEQIIAGIEPCERAEIDIDLSLLSEAGRRLVAGLAPEGWRPTIIRMTPEEVIAAIEVEVTAHTEAEQQRHIDDRNRILDANRLYQTPVDYSISHGVNLSVWAVRKIYLGTNTSDENRELETKTLTTLTEEAGKRNKKILDEMQPQIEAARIEEEARKVKEMEEKAAAEAAEKIRIAELRKKRLETGIYERHETRGDRREWGEPWIAKLSPTTNGRKPDYDFSVGSYDLATETLSIPCKPGEVIAFGQKNYRRPKKTIHEIRKMMDDGSMVSI
jgi:hypothetical protein